MTVRNLMEDIVKDTVQEVLKNDKGTSPGDANVDDIAAYVLNRIAARYVTSERGILHGKLDFRFATQQKMDMLFLIYEAISEIKTRRASFSGIGPQGGVLQCYPHIIGQVLEATTLSIIPNVQVTLTQKNVPTAMADPDWHNPFTTNKSTMGYYHFWPKYSEVDSDPHFELTFRHKSFKDESLEIIVQPVSVVDMAQSHPVPMVFLSLREGLNLDSVLK